LRAAIVFAAAGLLLAAGATAAEIPSPDLPKVDPDCIRLNTPPPILAALAAAGLDNAAARKVVSDNADALHHAAIVCHIPDSDGAAQRFGEVEEAIAIQTYAKQALMTKFAVRPAVLDATWDGLAAPSRLAFWKLREGQGLAALTPAAKADFAALAAAVGAKSGEPLQLLAIYAMSRSYIEALAAG